MVTSLLKKLLNVAILDNCYDVNMQSHKWFVEWQISNCKHHKDAYIEYKL